MEFSTRLIHSDQSMDLPIHSAVPPIFQTSTFLQEDLEKSPEFVYSRCSNPTRTALETCIASLENGGYALAFSSGMSAINAVFSLLQPGEHVLVGEDIYGGTSRLLTQTLQKLGIGTKFIDAANLEEMRRETREAPKIIWIETPTNPLLKIYDIRAIADIARQSGSLLVVDNTFATPYFQQPLELGADIVVHSTTKYINGHSDVIGGMVVTNLKDVYDTLAFHQKTVGAVPGAFDAWLTLRGVRTLAVRMEAHAKNARQIAEFLRSHPRIEEVFFPGFPDHPGHDIAVQQMNGFGGVVSVRIRGGYAETKKFFDRLQIFHLAESLGGVESLVNYPTRMSHGSLSSEMKERIGISENLVRISVGIEDITDLLKDLDQALDF